MKIYKYAKLKDNRYNVKIDDQNVKLYDDVIVKYELLRCKEIDEKLFEEIILYNDSLTAYYKALKYITIKLRTEKELRKYLSKEIESKVVDEVIKKLRVNGYLKEELYVKSFISDQINLGMDGPNKIKKTLINLGIEDELINEYLLQVNDEVWLNKIEQLIKKFIRVNKAYGNNKLKEKIVYDLGKKGYYKWMIEEVINSSEFKSDNDILVKEYSKLKDKLSRKYSDKELIYKITAKLLSKGFSLDEIKKVLSNE